MSKENGNKRDYKGWLDQLGKTFADVYGAITDGKSPGSGETVRYQQAGGGNDNTVMYIFGAVFIIIIIFAVYKMSE